MNEEFPESFEPLLANLLAESDRGCVLIATAYLDDTLESVLRTYFSQDGDCVRNAIDPMFEGVGPLSTFSAKTKLAFALKLINSEVYQNLEIVRRIRNSFAHSFEAVALTSEQVRNRIASLRLTASAEERINVRPETVQEEKLRFTSAVCYAIGFLQECAAAIGENTQ